MSDKLGFLDSLFDINGDGKVDFTDLADEAFILDAVDEEEKEEIREEKIELMEDLGIDPDQYDDDEIDEMDEFDIESLGDE